MEIMLWEKDSIDLTWDYALPSSWVIRKVKNGDYDNLFSTDYYESELNWWQMKRLHGDLDSKLSW